MKKNLNWHPMNSIIKDNSSFKDIRDGFFESLLEKYKKDKKIIIITADQGAFLLNDFKTIDSQRCLFFNISEQHMVSFASGLALSGFKVFIYAISSFLIFKTVEQIKIDLDLNPKIDLTLIGSGTGLCYSADGPTHHSLEDLAVMRAFKNINIFTPSNYIESASISNTIMKYGGINYVRLDKGSFPYKNKTIKFSRNENLVKLNISNSFKCIISYGIIINYIFDNYNKSIKKINFINLIKANPLSYKTINYLKSFKSILIIEEALSEVSLASILKEKLYGTDIQINEISVKNNNNYDYGSRDYLLKKLLFNKSNLMVLQKFLK